MLQKLSTLQCSLPVQAAVLQPAKEVEVDPQKVVKLSVSVKRAQMLVCLQERDLEADQEKRKQLIRVRLLAPARALPQLKRGVKVDLERTQIVLPALTTSLLLKTWSHLNELFQISRRISVLEADLENPL